MTYEILGRLTVTNGIHEAETKSPSFQKFIQRSLGRYMRNGWGDMDEDDLKMNDEVLDAGHGRIMAAYKFPEANDYGVSMDDRIWIITEQDHSATTILFPSEY